MEKLAKLREGKLVVAKVNTDELTDVAARYRISGIPTFILFEKGREARRASGAMPASAIAQTMQV
jgi:thioredoxin-like negative regulator of GroEL